MIQLTDTQRKNLNQKIYELLMGATLPCECGAECSLGMGEMGEARDEADRIIDEWIEEENPKPVLAVFSNSSYYKRQLADVMPENVTPEYAPAVKVFSNGNGTDTNTMSLNNDSAKELIFWLAKNFVNMDETELSPNGVTVFF